MGAGNNRRATINTNNRTLHNKCHYVIYSGLEFIYLKPSLTRQMNLYNHIKTPITLFFSVKKNRLAIIRPQRKSRTIFVLQCRFTVSHNDQACRGLLITANQNNKPRQHNPTRPLYHNEENLRCVGVWEVAAVSCGGGGAPHGSDREDLHVCESMFLSCSQWCFLKAPHISTATPFFWPAAHRPASPTTTHPLTLHKYPPGQELVEKQLRFVFPRQTEGRCLRCCPVWQENMSQDLKNTCSVSLWCRGCGLTVFGFGGISKCSLG